MCEVLETLRPAVINWLDLPSPLGPWTNHTAAGADRICPQCRPYLALRRGGRDRLGLGANGTPGKQVRLLDGTTGYQLESLASVRCGRTIRTLAPWGRNGVSNAGRGGGNRQAGREERVRSWAVASNKKQVGMKRQIG